MMMTRMLESNGEKRRETQSRIKVEEENIYFYTCFT